MEQPKQFDRYSKLMFEPEEPKEKEEKPKFKTHSLKWFKRLRAKRKAKKAIAKASKRKNHR